MLTGDNEVLAQAVAEKVGITEVQAGLLPDDKLVAVGLLQERYGEVGMVGDGVNDAPAMARAAIGFAMGAAGTDTALETADVAFMDDDLRKLPEFLDISRRTAHVLRQNIVVAIGIKGLFFILTLMGIATLWMAVFADVGTSLLVVANGLRLLRGAGSSPGQSASAAGERSTQSTVAQSGESA
jgi:Cd2+/Zn2+-exporting ATPase